MHTSSSAPARRCSLSSHPQMVVNPTSRERHISPAWYQRSSGVYDPREKCAANGRMIGREENMWTRVRKKEKRMKAGMEEATVRHKRAKPEATTRIRLTGDEWWW